MRIQEVAAAARKILYEHETEPVAMVVISKRLDFDMLAHHVVAAILERLDIEHHRLVGRRRKQPVRPPPLIERAEQKHRLIIQEEPQISRSVAAFFNLAHTEIATDSILAVDGGELVKMRIVGRPGFEFIAELDLNTVAPLERADPVDRHLDAGGTAPPGEFERDFRRTAIEIGLDAIAVNVGFADRFGPYRTDNAARSRIEATAGIYVLLAARIDKITIIARAGRIPHADGEFVLPGAHVIGDVERERQLPALVRNGRHFAVADKHHRAKIDAVEMENEPPSGFGPVFELARIP